MNNNNLNDILNSIDINADWVGLREVKESTTYRSIRDGNPQLNSKETSHGLLIEVLINGQFGYYGTNSFNQDKIQKAAEKALMQAKLASNWSVHKFNTDVRPKSVGTYISPRLIDDKLSPKELNHILLCTNSKLKESEKIVSATSLAKIVETQIKFVSSNGSDIYQDFLLISTDISATAQDGNIIQTRSANGKMAKSYQAGYEVLAKQDLMDTASIVAEQAIELLTAEECPNNTMDLVLAPDQMMLQIHESIGHALEIDRILGDERNYAGWSFVRLNDFGNMQYGSPLLNVTFDPTLSGEFASYKFDDGGLEAKKDYIIKNGKLLRGLGGLESQFRSDISGVANFRSSNWNRAPIDRMANLNIESGSSTFEEIINSVKNGVFMETNRSWSIDDYRNKFQFGCEYGKLIKNGKLTKTIKNPNYRGISTPFWNSLKMTGNKSTFEFYGTPYCGKGEPNQAIRVGHASPVCLFENVEVFGGA